MGNSSSHTRPAIGRTFRPSFGTTGRGSSRIASPRSPSLNSTSCSPTKSAPACCSPEQAGDGDHAAFLQPDPSDDPDCPIRRQVIPRIEESWDDPDEMSDPCGEDSAHAGARAWCIAIPDRVLFLVTDRCASYCRYCTRSRVVSGVGEQELHTEFEAAFRYLEEHTEVRDVLLSRRRRPALQRRQARGHPRAAARDPAHRVPPHRLARPDLPAAAHHAGALRRCCRSTIRSG